MNVKKSLNIALAKKGLSMTQFAKMMGVSRQRIYALNTQTVWSADLLERICTTLNMKLSDFIALSED